MWPLKDTTSSRLYIYKYIYTNVAPDFFFSKWSSGCQGGWYCHCMRPYATSECGLKLLGAGQRLDMMPDFFLLGSRGCQGGWYWGRAASGADA